VAFSLVPELALSNVREDIVIRPLAGRDMPVRRVVAATRAGGFRSPATTAILEQVAGEYVERRDRSAALRSAS